MRVGGGAATTLVALEDVIAHHLDALFPGMEILDYDVFRVTRDADLEVSDDAADLLQAVEDELRRRRFGGVVRVEVGERCSAQLRGALVALLGMEEEAIYPSPASSIWAHCGRSSSSPASPSCVTRRWWASPTPGCSATRASAPTC